MGFFRQFQSTPTDFPRDLLAPQPLRPSYPPAGVLLVVLFLACLVPRLLMALRIAGNLCPDGVLYVQLAKALEAGDLTSAFREVQLNTFPVILAALHHFGLDWEWAGMSWNVFISCLAVLPLFGWARRLFDDRVALLACLLYALHPKCIQWSPELIRDPTFWFLFTLSLYCSWRAVIEVRRRWFLAAGAAITLAFLTRFEGILLFIPLLLWSFARWRVLPRQRRTLLVGNLLALAVLPLFLATINLTWLFHHPTWEISRIKPLELVQPWLQAMLGHPPDAATNAALGLADTQARMDFAETFRKFLHVAEGGFAHLFALLMFGGVIAWQRVWRRWEHLATLPLALAIVAGMWIHLWCTQTSNNRYVLPIVIMGTVFAALGLWSFSAWLTRLLKRLSPLSLPPAAALAGMLLVAGAFGLGEALITHSGFHYGEATLGRWLNAHCGPAPTILGSEGPTIVVGYYANGSSRSFPLYSDDRQILREVRNYHPDIVLLVVTNWMRKTKSDRYAALLDAMHREGFQQIDPARLPEECDRLLVLARRPASATAGNSPRATEMVNER